MESQVGISKPGSAQLEQSELMTKIGGFIKAEGAELHGPELKESNFLDMINKIFDSRWMKKNRKEPQMMDMDRVIIYTEKIAENVECEHCEMNTATKFSYTHNKHMCESCYDYTADQMFKGE
jgi:formylmethanofuran dehydrogenase subunit E